MRLTIQNIERLNEIGDSKSPFIALSKEHDSRYEMTMQYEGWNWNVVIYRDTHPAHHHYRILVQCIGLTHFETTAVSRTELNSVGLTLSIIESLMNKIIKKVKV